MIGSASGTEQARWRTEVLRRTSAVLHGRMVGVWEVSAGQTLVPVASNVTDGMAWDAAPEVGEALRRLGLPAPQGSRWIAGRLGDVGEWCVVPVRDRAPDPPPRAQERRRRERLALELAGLCLGLSNGVAAQGSGDAEPDLFQRFTHQLGTLAENIAGPLATARASLSEMIGALRAAEPPDRASRDRLLDQIRTAERALLQAANLVWTVQERAWTVLAHSGDFDVVQAVWSAVNAERQRGAARGVKIDLTTLGYMVSIAGDAGDLRRAVVLMVRGLVDSLGGRPGSVEVTIEDVGPVARLTVKAPAAESAPERAGTVLGEVRRIVERSLGGSFASSFAAGEGATVTVTLPVSPGRPPYREHQPR